MKENRTVNFSTKFKLVMQKPIKATFAFVFTFFALIIAIVLGIISSALKGDFPEVNYEEVNQHGTSVTGTINEIEIQYNTIVNGKHPAILSYSYEYKGVLKTSKVKTLEPSKVKQLSIGDPIVVKTLNDQSIIIGFKPFSFPIGFFFIFPAMFLVIGLVFLFPLLYSVSKKLKLYKEGRIIEGEILAMTPNSGLPITNIGKSVDVHYSYIDSQGARQIGNSKTTDFSILNDKKKGEAIKILVLPRNGTKSCIYPNLIAIKNQWDN